MEFLSVVSSRRSCTACLRIYGVRHSLAVVHQRALSSRYLLSLDDCGSKFVVCFLVMKFSIDTG